MTRIIASTSLLVGALGSWGLGVQRSPEPALLTLAIGGGAVAIGDMNSDRTPDIVTTAPDAVAIYLGDGRGGFRQAPGSPFAAGNNPNDIVLGDFNEDGRLDIAIANHETSYLSVLLAGRTGPSRPFQVAVPSRPHPHGVASGDFNRDRHLDLAVESWDENSVLILHGNGKGVFASEPTRVTVGRKPYHKLRAADLNDDGTADMVTTNTDGSSVSVLCSDGRGALRPARDIATAASPFAVAMGDVNGDRHLDMAVAHRWGSVDPNRDRLTVLLGAGDCTFTASSESPMTVGTSPTDVAIGDVDGDGIGDIAVANMGSDDVSLFLGGQSGFRPANGSPLPTGQRPTAIALADLNGDRKADIVTGNIGSRSLSVRFSPY
jgi:hypothetical protein